jgi:hypothetical protein
LHWTDVPPARLGEVSEKPYILGPDGLRREGETKRRDGQERPLRIDEQDLSFIRVDHQTRLQFGGTEVVIECPFTLRRDDREVQLDPADRGSLGPILTLYPDSLTSAFADDDGTLRMEFVSGTTIVVPQDPQYEAWQVNGPGAYLVVCTPGTTGDLAIWS